MTENDYNVVIAICAIALALLAYSSEFANYRLLRRVNKLSFKILVTMVSILIGGWATFQKDELSAHALQYELLQRDSVMTVELRRRDSASNAALRIRDSSKYAGDLKAQKEISAKQSRIVDLVRDSMSKEIPDFGVLPAPKAFYFNYNPATKELGGNLSMANTGNCPVISTIFYYVVFRFKNDIYRAAEARYLMFKERRISAQQVHNQPIILKNIDHLPEKIYVYVTGDYRSANAGKTKIPYNDIVVYDLAANVWGSDLYSVEEKVKSVLRETKTLD